MYLPYLRAKQYDLAAIAELNSDICESQKVIPIIEPVSAIKDVHYKKIRNAKIPFILVVNPIVGEISSSTPNLSIVDILVNKAFKDYNNYWLGFIIQPTTTLRDVKNFITSFPNHYHAFIHFHKHSQNSELAKLILSDKNNHYNIFIDGYSTYSYINQFAKNGVSDIYIVDGFKKREKNELYPSEDFFSDLHQTYLEQNFQGFGDFTVIGSKYEKGGGPAYVVAIHLTDEDEDGGLKVNHFKSEILIPPSSADPGGKFYEALQKTKKYLDTNKHLDTAGILEYKKLHKNKHFPGLGIPKKLSIMHHIEFIFTNYLSKK